MSDFGARLIARLQEASDRNWQVLVKNEKAREKISEALPSIAKELKGNEIILAAIREIYGVLEEDGEELSTVVVELKEAKDALEIAKNLLEQAGYDFANIQQFSNDEIWLADHLDTIERFVDIVNLQKLEVALDKAKKERFEDFAHAVKRSGENRQSKAEAGAAGVDPETEAADAALAAIDAIKVATELRDALDTPADEESQG